MQSLSVNRSQANQATQILLFILVSLVVTSFAWYISKLDVKWAIFSFMGLLFPFVAFIVRDLRRWLIWLMVFLLPLSVNYHFFFERSFAGQHGIALGTTEILLFILVVQWIYNAVRQKMTRSIKLYPWITLPTLAFIVMNLVSMLVAKSMTLAFFDAVGYLKMLVFFLFLANNLRDKRDFSMLLSAMFLGLIIQSILMLIQYYKGSPLGLIGTTEIQSFMAFQRGDYYISRPGGTIGIVNSYSRYLGLVLPIAAVMMLTSNDRRNIVPSFLASIGGIAALIVSQTRSVWGAFVVCMAFAIVAIFTHNLLTMRLIKRLIVGLALFSALLITHREVIYLRMTSNDYGSAMARVTTAKVALKMIKDHPIIGVGANNYELYVRKYWDIEDRFTKGAVVHNHYLLVMAQLGILGFGVFLWFLIAYYVRIRRAMKSKVKYFRQIAVGIFASFICFLLAALMDYYPMLVLFYFLWTLAAIIEAINGLGEEYDERMVELIASKRHLYEF